MKRKGKNKKQLWVIVLLELILVIALLVILKLISTRPKDTPQIDDEIGILINWDNQVADQDEALQLLSTVLQDSCDETTLESLQMVEPVQEGDTTIYQAMQYYENYPVHGGKVTLQTGNQGTAIRNNLIEIKDISREDKFDLGKITEACRRYLASRDEMIEEDMQVTVDPACDHVWYTGDSDKTVLGYYVTIQNGKTTYLIIMDASSCKVLREIRCLKEEEGREQTELELPAEVLTGLQECLAYLNQGSEGSSDMYRIIRQMSESGLWDKQELINLLNITAIGMPCSCSKRQFIDCLKEQIHYYYQEESEQYTRFLQILEEEIIIAEYDFTVKCKTDFCMQDSDGIIVTDYDLEVTCVYEQTLMGIKESGETVTYTGNEEGRCSLNLKAGYYRFCIIDHTDPDKIRRYTVAVSNSYDSSEICIDTGRTPAYNLKPGGTLNIRNDEGGDVAGWNLVIRDSQGNYLNTTDSLKMEKGYYYFIFTVPGTVDQREASRTYLLRVSGYGDDTVTIVLPDRCDVFTHVLGQATCTEPARCTICGESSGEPAGHKWLDATCVKPKTCSVCGLEEGDVAEHTYSEATCTEPKTCTFCGAKDGKALGHDWIDATYDAPKTCRRCGKTEGQKLVRVSSDGAYDLWDVYSISKDGDYITVTANTDGGKKTLIAKSTSSTRYIYSHCADEYDPKKPYEMSSNYNLYYHQVYYDDDGTPHYYGEIDEYITLSQFKTLMGYAPVEMKIKNGNLVHLRIDMHH